MSSPVWTDADVTWSSSDIQLCDVRLLPDSRLMAGRHPGRRFSLLSPRSQPRLDPVRASSVSNLRLLLKVLRLMRQRAHLDGNLLVVLGQRVLGDAHLHRLVPLDQLLDRVAGLVAQVRPDPGQQLDHAGVHARHAALAAADAPGHDADLDVLVRVGEQRTHPGRSAVPAARVDARLSARAGEGLVEPEPAAQSRLTQLLLAVFVGDLCQVDLLHDVLVLAALELVAAEAGGDAFGWVVKGDSGGHHIRIRKAYPVNVWLELHLGT